MYRKVRTTDRHREQVVRSEHFRYNRCSDGSEELFDHRRDPDEWVNSADHPA